MQNSKDLPEYYQGYLLEMEEYVPFASGRVNDALGKSFELFMELMSTIYPEQVHNSYAEGKWTIAEVLGHIIDSERIFSYRALQIARGSTENIPGYDQDEYVENSNYHQRDFESLKSELFTGMESSGYLFEGLTDEQLDTMGMANDQAITPRTIGMLMAAHRIHHINILQQRYLSQL